MIAPELIRQHRRALDDVTYLAGRDLRRHWRTLDLDDAPGSTRALVAASRELASDYGDLAAVIAADFYDETQAAAGQMRGRASASPSAPASQVEAMTRAAVTPLWSTSPRYDDALRDLISGLERMTLQPARDTIVDNAARHDVRYARVPASNSTCDWCLMLASRGAVYHSEDTASLAGVAGRRRSGPRGYIPPGYGRSSGQRRPQPVGGQYHDHCRCEVLPIWTGADLPQINRDLADEWQQATRGHHDQLQAWRQHVAATRA